MKTWLAAVLLLLLAVPFHPYWQNYEQARRGLLLLLVPVLCLLPRVFPKDMPRAVLPFLFLSGWMLLRSIGVDNPGLAWERTLLWLSLAALMIVGSSMEPRDVVRATLPAGLVVSCTPIIDHAGGSPVLWQHLFWFFGHPEVYIAIIPGMGATSHILATFARKPIFGYKAMVAAIFAIGALGFFVWGHHMFISGMSPYTGIAFSLLTLTIGVPSAIKTVNWLGTLWGGKIRFTTAMLFALGFVSLFVTGGLGGIFLGQDSIDLFLHDTYFVVGHFHMIMGVAAIFGIFGATYYWFPKMFGRMMNDGLGKIHFIGTFIGVYLIFVPMHALGFMGHPRRYYDSTDYDFLQGAAPLQTLITWAAVGTAAVQCLFLFNFLWSLFKGKKAPVNPWESTSLEWTVSSPPPFENFDVDPVVHHGPYEYSVPDAESDFTMQDAPPTRAGGAT